MSPNKYSIRCVKCQNSFSSSLSYHKHWDSRHQGADRPRSTTFSLGENTLTFPRKATKGRRSTAYKVWLSSAAQRVRNTHHYRCKGKWHQLEFHHVSYEFFRNVMSGLGNPTPNTVTFKSHWRAPIMSQSTLVESYKVFENDCLERLFGKGSCPVHIAWRGQKLASVNEEDELNSEDPLLALAAAKRRANDPGAYSPITCRSSIVIGTGEGRATRELEIKWFPYIYGEKIECGKMCLRFYVAKFRFSGIIN